MEMVRQEEQYNRAQRRHLQWLAHGADLGAGGNLKTKREHLMSDVNLQGVFSNRTRTTLWMPFICKPVINSRFGMP